MLGRRWRELVEQAVARAMIRAARAALDSGRRLRGRLLGALGPAPPRVLDRPLRPREHGPVGLVDRARPPAPDHRPARRPGLPARRALRPDPRRLRAALARLAEPGHAARHAGGRGRARRAARLLARAQAPRQRAGRRRLRARLPRLPADPVADAERVPPGRARLPAAAVRDLVPRRGPPAPVRALRGGRRDHEGGDRARRRRARDLVRARPRPALDRSGDRRGRRGGRR